MEELRKLFLRFKNKFQEKYSAKQVEINKADFLDSAKVIFFDEVKKFGFAIKNQKKYHFSLKGRRGTSSSNPKKGDSIKPLVISDFYGSILKWEECGNTSFDEAYLLKECSGIFLEMSEDFCASLGCVQATCSYKNTKELVFAISCGIEDNKFYFLLSTFMGNKKVFVPMEEQKIERNKIYPQNIEDYLFVRNFVSGKGHNIEDNEFSMRLSPKDIDTVCINKIMDDNCLKYIIISDSSTIIVDVDYTNPWLNGNIAIEVENPKIGKILLKDICRYIKVSEKLVFSYSDSEDYFDQKMIKLALPLIQGKISGDIRKHSFEFNFSCIEKYVKKECRPFSRMGASWGNSLGLQDYYVMDFPLKEPDSGYSIYTEKLKEEVRFIFSQKKDDIKLDIIKKNKDILLENFFKKNSGATSIEVNGRIIPVPEGFKVNYHQDDNSYFLQIMSSDDRIYYEYFSKKGSSEKRVQEYAVYYPASYDRHRGPGSYRKHKEIIVPGSVHQSGKSSNKRIKIEDFLKNGASCIEAEIKENNSQLQFEVALIKEYLCCEFFRVCFLKRYETLDHDLKQRVIRDLGGDPEAMRQAGIIN